MAGARSLTADCAQCFGLCCVVPAFSASADFAIDKPAGQPCPNLRPDFRCGIHHQLRERGFPGCTVYDCFGAGQYVAQVTFGGRDWRRSPGVAAAMFRAFPVVRALHELLWYLDETLRLPAAASLAPELKRAIAATERLTEGSPQQLAAADVAAQRDRVNAILVRASELVRGGVAGRAELRGADLVGRNLRGADLRGANLRGAHLIGADLRAADLTLADVTGADLRAADVRGTDLAGCLFLTQAQVDSARGDAGTRLPESRHHSPHWIAISTVD